MNSKAVSIVVPVKHLEKAAMCRRACELYAKNVEHELLFEEDVDNIGCPQMVKKLVEQSKYDNICFLGDDTIPQEGFLEAALDVLEETSAGKGVVFLNDGLSIIARHNHWLASKELLPKIGGEFFHTGYHHCCCDDELAERADQLKLYGYSDKSVVLHDSPVVFNSGELIEGSTYSDVYNYRSYIEDKILFGKRKANNWQTPGPDYFLLAIGLPFTDELVLRQFVLSFITMSKPFDWMLQVPTLKVHSFSKIRNGLIDHAVMDGCTHLVMMDTDQIYPRDTLIQLLKHKDKDVVGTRIHRRYPPFDVMMFRGELRELIHVPDEECFSGELVGVDCTGAGCMLINLAMLPDVPAPWFHEEGGVGEDIYFTHKVTDCGRKVYVDTSIEIDHMTQYLVNRSTYEQYKLLTGFKWRPADVPKDERMDGVKYKNTIAEAKAAIEDQEANIHQQEVQ